MELIGADRPLVDGWVLAGHVECVKLLLSKWANVNPIDRMGACGCGIVHTPYHLPPNPLFCPFLP